ncbi:hypothetical protein ACIBTP_08780 [Streptomyces avidinii]|uniref:hypothetical protein n=1 Tax=Streptomyces avidinii TaxID=1895 RepID=UPI0037BACFAD
MTSRNWLITGVSSGFGHALTTRLPERGEKATDPAPLRMVLGSPALDSALAVLRKRIDDFETQRDLAPSTDFPAGE